MSLQVCHCGWSKVTSHHGLRTHQGKMGCALKGAKVAEREQQYMWSTVGLSYAEKDVRMDVYSSLKTDSYSDMSLQVCHCGWAKMTTYQGLRIHQGKMGCTPKGMKIQKREQYDGKAQWKVEEEHIKQQITKRTIKKEVCNYASLFCSAVYSRLKYLSNYCPGCHVCIRIHSLTSSIDRQWKKCPVIN